MDEHPVLLTEPPHNPTSHREQLAEIFFETFRAPALFVAPPAVLSLYASGRTTGVVLDVGEGVTHCIPVYEGYALPHSIIRSDLGGGDVTKRLQLLLRKNGLAFSTTAESDFCSLMKEEVCYVSNKPTGGMSNDYDIRTASDNTTTSATTTPKAQYQLPDGQVITLSNERHRSSEVLFNPSLIGSEERPIHDVLLTSILQSDMDLRSTLFTNIVLSGGSTLQSSRLTVKMEEHQQVAEGAKVNAATTKARLEEIQCRLKSLPVPAVKVTATKRPALRIVQQSRCVKAKSDQDNRISISAGRKSFNAVTTQGEESPISWI